MKRTLKHLLAGAFMLLAFSSCTGATTFRAAIYACSSITSGESPYDEIDGVRVHLYERANYPSVYTAPRYCSYCFDGCTGLSDYSSIPSSWGGGASSSSISSKTVSATEIQAVLPAVTIENPPAVTP